MYNYRDHFLARFRDILAFFCKKSHQNSRSEKKKSHAEFFSFRVVKFLFCTCSSFQDYQTVLFDRFLNCLFIVLGFNDTSTHEGHFVSSPREREKRDRRESRGDKRGTGKKEEQE